jgi:hypothetical protein
LLWRICRPKMLSLSMRECRHSLFNLRYAKICDQRIYRDAICIASDPPLGQLYRPGWNFLKNRKFLRTLIFRIGGSSFLGLRLFDLAPNKMSLTGNNSLNGWTGRKFPSPECRWYEEKEESNREFH